MKTNDSINSNTDYLNHLNNELKNKIAQREKEVENVKNLFDKKIEEENKQGELAYLNRIDQNNQKLVSASSDLENKLKNINDHIEKTKLGLEQEEKALKENNQAQIFNMKNQFSETYTNTYDNGLEKQNDIQFKTQQEVRNITEKANRQIDRLQNQTQQSISALSVDYNNKIGTDEKNYRDVLNEDIKQHRDELLRQKDQFKLEMTKSDDKNKRLELEKQRINNDQLSYIDNYHKNLMDQKQKDFKIRYENQIKDHERILSELKNKLDEDIRKIQINNQNAYRAIASKNNDTFYRIDKLNPTLSEDKKSYIISIEVPEHEKDSVHLVAHGRMLKLDLNKKFNDIVEDSDGSINRSSKTQIFSKEFATKELLNPKQITQKYEDGVLSFKVDKL